MKSIKSIIIDDEPGSILTLVELLKQYCPEVLVIKTALNGEAGYEILLKEQPQLVFLDIEMPHGNAFHLLDKFPLIDFEVIFVTAFDSYAITAFKYAAVDYILKPVSIIELKAAVKKVIERIEKKDTNSRITLLLDNLKANSQAIQKIGLPALDGFIFEDIGNITHLEAQGSYTKVFTIGNKSEVVSKRLREFEDILPNSIFCRIHHSHIININSVKRYYKGRGGYVELNDGTTIEVSVRKKEEFLHKFRH